MLNGRNASRPGAFVVIDDYSNTFPDVKVAWARAQKEGWIYEIICVDKCGGFSPPPPSPPHLAIKFFRYVVGGMRLRSVRSRNRFI